MNEEQLRETMLELAKSYRLEPTENFDKIVKAKMRFGIELACPCDRNNPERGCISELCIKDVYETGTCHCRCFRKG